MASITIRNLSDDLKRRLRIQAAEHGHSMEEEAREILRVALAQRNATVNLAHKIRERFEPFGGIELEIPQRDQMRDPPEFGE